VKREKKSVKEEAGIRATKMERKAWEEGCTKQNIDSRERGAKHLKSVRKGSRIVLEMNNREGEREKR